MAQISMFWGELREGTSWKLHIKANFMTTQTQQGFTETKSMNASCEGISWRSGFQNMYLNKGGCSWGIYTKVVCAGFSRRVNKL